MKIKELTIEQLKGCVIMALAHYKYCVADINEDLELTTNVFENMQKDKVVVLHYVKGYEGLKEGLRTSYSSIYCQKKIVLGSEETTVELLEQLVDAIESINQTPIKIK